MPEVLGVGRVARILGVKPSVITRLFYDGKLRGDLCPIVDGRRQIRPDYVRFIVFELRRKGISVKNDWEAAIEGGAANGD